MLTVEHVEVVDRKAVWVVTEAINASSTTFLPFNTTRTPERLSYRLNSAASHSYIPASISSIIQTFHPTVRITSRKPRTRNNNQTYLYLPPHNYSIQSFNQAGTYLYIRYRHIYPICQRSIVRLNADIHLQALYPSSTFSSTTTHHITRSCLLPHPLYRSTHTSASSEWCRPSASFVGQGLTQVMSQCFMLC